MREFINITESYVTTTWPKDAVDRVEQTMIDRFKNMDAKKISVIHDEAGNIYQIWSKYPTGDYVTFYAVTDEGRPVAYINIHQIKDMYYKIGMVFVSPKFTKKGIAKALYSFCLDRDFTIISDSELTKGSKAIWRSFFIDPNYSVKMIKDFRDEPYTIVDIKNIDTAFTQTDRRLILTKKNALTESTEPFPIPKVWYHSTELDPEIVAADFANNNVDPTGAVKGLTQYWFSDSWDASRYYGENTVAATLHFHNPLLVTTEQYNAKKPHGPTSWAAMANRLGHDAVIIHDICDGDQFSTVCAVFDADIIQAQAYSRWNEDIQDFDML